MDFRSEYLWYFAWMTGHGVEWGCRRRRARRHRHRRHSWIAAQSPVDSQALIIFNGLKTRWDVSVRWASSGGSAAALRRSRLVRLLELELELQPNNYDSLKLELRVWERYNSSHLTRSSSERCWELRQIRRNTHITAVRVFHAGNCVRRPDL